MNVKYKQFTIYWCNLEPTFGHKIKKTRPCVIVSPDEMNSSLGTVIVVPLTSTKRNFPFYVPVKYLNHESSLACDQIKTIDKRRVVEEVVELTKNDAEKLSNVLVAMFSSY
jgi:mRNA interferase MazF